MGISTDDYILKQIDNMVTKLNKQTDYITYLEHRLQYLNRKFNDLQVLVMLNMERAVIMNEEGVEVDGDYEYIFRLYSTLDKEFKTFCDLLNIDPEECFDD